MSTNHFFRIDRFQSPSATEESFSELITEKDLDWKLKRRKLITLGKKYDLRLQGSSCRKELQRMVV